jgi:hypothetical protein
MVHIMKMKAKEGRATMLSIVESQWKASMEDKVATMGAKMDSVESKVAAMSKSISIIKDLLMQKRNKGRGCKLVAPKDPPPSDVPQNMATPLAEGRTLKEMAAILVPGVETIKPTPPSLKVGSSGQGVDTPQQQCLGLKFILVFIFFRIPTVF